MLFIFTPHMCSSGFSGCCERDWYTHQKVRPLSSQKPSIEGRRRDCGVLRCPVLVEQPLAVSRGYMSSNQDSSWISKSKLKNMSSLNKQHFLPVWLCPISRNEFHNHAENGLIELDMR